MSFRALIPALVLAVSAAPLMGDEKQVPPKPVINNPAFDQFKKLAGEWVGKGHDGEEMHVTYKVTAGGSAVVETIMPGGPHEMVTVIHPDGADLILTHYCMLGNQPQMRATGLDGNKVAFKFVRATNLKSDKDMHMHDATYTFVDADTLKSEWSHYVDGKNAGQMAMEMKRKASTR
jgi:hypothetical protein